MRRSIVREHASGAARGDYDAVCVGSGINALVAAALLAHAGWRVVVLERSDRLGGAVRTEELTEPGFLHDVFSTSHATFVASDAYALLRDDLTRLGLRYVRGELPAASLLPEGTTSFLTTDLEGNVAAFERQARGDGVAWAALVEELREASGIVRRLLGSELRSAEGLRLAAFAWRRLGTRGLAAFTGRMLVTCRDWLAADFASDGVRGLLAPWSLHGGLGPDAAGSALAAQLLTTSLEERGAVVPVGGGARLVDALAGVIASAGGECHTEVDVQAILVERNRATGVRLLDREVVTARRAVIAGVTPHALYGSLLPPGAVAPSVVAAARRFRFGRARMQIHFALRERPRWVDDERLAGAATIHVTDGVDGISRAVNEAERGLLPARATITCAQPTAIDPTRAPGGGAVLSVQLHELPWRVRGDAAGELETGDGTWTKPLRERYADRVERRLARAVANLDSALVGRVALSPADLVGWNPNFERGDGASGSCALDQALLWRPGPALPGHRTPVRGLFHVGASTHPGPGLGAGSGAIVARRLLRFPRRP